MKKVLFLYSGFMGHLNRTYSIQQYYLDRGGHVEFIIFSKAEIHFGLPGVVTTYLNQEPFYRLLSGSGDILTQQTQERILFLGEILKKEIKNAKPDVLFIDEFCALELMLLIPMINEIKMMVLSTFLPSFPNDFFPPHFVFGFPGTHNKKIWEEIARSESERLRNKRTLVLNCFMTLGLPEQYHIWNFNQIHPSYSHIPKAYLSCKETDFGGQALKPWECYLGPAVKVEHSEKSYKLVDLYINHAIKNKKKILLVSLGTVIHSHLTNADLDRFFTMIFQIAWKRPAWIFFVKFPRTTGLERRLKSLNVLMVDYLPQIRILQHADLMVTHGGGGSVFEALYNAVPMLIIPPKDVFDYNGNAARMVWLGVARHMTFNDGPDVFEHTIESMISDTGVKKNAEKWSTFLHEKYPSGYLNRMDFLP